MSIKMGVETVDCCGATMTPEAWAMIKKFLDEDGRVIVKNLEGLSELIIERRGAYFGCGG